MIECVKEIIIDMTRVTILKKNIDNKLWPEIVLVITYIKNNSFTKAFLSNATPHKVQSQENIINILYL